MASLISGSIKISINIIWTITSFLLLSTFTTHLQANVIIHSTNHSHSICIARKGRVNRNRNKLIHKIHFFLLCVKFFNYIYLILILYGHKLIFLDKKLVPDVYSFIYHNYTSIYIISNILKINKCI